MAPFESSLRSMFEHNLWANQRLFAYCATLTAEQLDGRVAGTYGRIRDTLQHLAMSERSYVSRISSGQRIAAEPAALPIKELMDMNRLSGAKLIDWAERVTADQTFETKWKDDRMVKIPTSVLLIQAINHATEHRAQIATTITQLGLEPPAMDAWTYFATVRGLPE